MTTVADAVEQTYRKLGRRAALNLLSGTLGASDAIVNLTYDNQVPVGGGRLSIGLEDMHVWSMAALAATVQRGVGGSIASGASSGALVYIDAEYTPFEVVGAVNDILALLPGMGVVQFKTTDLVADASKDGYDLTSVADLLRVHRVSYEELGHRDHWPIVPSRHWSVQQKSVASEFASGESLTVFVPIDPGRTIRVLYQAPFTPAAALTDDLESTLGLPASLHPLLVVGAAYRLLLSRAPSRASLESQGETRRPGEVSVNDARSAIGSLFSEFTQSVMAAKKDQLRKYGVG